MTEVAITDARGRLASIIDTARHEPVYLTRRNRPIAAIIDADQLNRLIEDAEELADIRAVDAAWEETERLSGTTAHRRSSYPKASPGGEASRASGDRTPCG